MSKKKQVTLSYLYGCLIQGTASHDDLMLVAKILKTIAINESAKVPFLVFSDDGRTRREVDLELKEPRDHF